MTGTAMVIDRAKDRKEVRMDNVQLGRRKFVRRKASDAFDTG